MFNNYKEIVTKAIIGKGKKTFKDEYEIEVDKIPDTVSEKEASRRARESRLPREAQYAFLHYAAFFLPVIFLTKGI